MAPIRQGRKISEAELNLRDSIFPGAEERLWEKTRDQGFATIPKTMPYIVRIIDEMSAKGKPLGHIYQMLWTYTWNSNGFLRLGNLADLAFVAGFRGERGERTFRERLRALEDLGFLELKAHGANPTGFAFIPNPHKVILDLQEAHRAADATTRARLPRLREDSFIAFLVRAGDVKAVDVARIQEEQLAAKKAAPPAAAPNPVRVKRRGKVPA